MNINKLLKNQVVVIVACVLATLNVVGYVSIAAYECIAVFALAVFGLKYVTKHVPLQILGALLVSNILFGCGRKGKLSEGFGPLTMVKDMMEKAKDMAAKVTGQ